MWKILQQALPWLLIILIFSQYVIPLIFNQQTWWLFKSNKKSVKEPENSESTPLTKEVEETKIIVNEVKEKVSKVKDKVDQNYKSAEDLKKETDNLI